MNAQMNNKNVSVNGTVPQNKADPSHGFSPLAILSRRRWQFLACMLIVCGVALAATVLHKEQYQSVSQVQVLVDQPH